MSSRVSSPHSSSTRYGDRMTDADAVLWRIESDPALRSTIVSAWVLDGPPDADRFRRKLEICIAEVPRLRQRPVEDPLGIAPPRWEDDPHFDIDFHLRRLGAPGDGSLRAFLDLAEPIGMQAFDRARPLWELYLVSGLEGGRTGVIMKLHHAISDGVGLVRMTEGLIERSVDEEAVASGRAPASPVAGFPPDDALTRTTHALANRLATTLDRAGRLTRSLGRALPRLVTEPAAVVRGLAAQASSIGRLVAPVSEPMSPLMTGRSLSVRYDHIEIPLDALKQAARRVGGTLNDAFVAAVAGGLRRYHVERGRPVDALRMNMPINLRSGDRSRDAGNQFAPVRFAVPIAIEDPAERMRAIHEAVLAQRDEPALGLLEEISGVIGSLPGSGPALVSGAMMKAVDFTTSNVPGPRFPVYVSGARIERMFGFGPLAGAAINVTCFSYDGRLGIGINTDPAAVDDDALFAECLRKGFDEVLAIV